MGQGTGLGLSTVAAIVQSHSGFINLYSEAGRGTSFKIYFPALPDQENQKSDHPQTHLPMGAGELILIVDDEAAVREIAKLVLEAHGYRVIEARDGAEGVEVYLKNRDEIRLVISDMDMPIMNGIAMIRNLERIDPSVRVISASGLVPNGKSPQNTEPDSPYRKTLPKPYTAADLLHMVDTLISAA
jgi:CheY-like chemotaxis protein